jgi:hypothetical protein
MVRKPDKSKTPDFFIIMTSMQFFHLEGEKPSNKGMFVRVQSIKEIFSFIEPAFMVEKVKEEGKQEIFSLARFQKRRYDSNEIFIAGGRISLIEFGISHC